MKMDLYHELVKQLNQLVMVYRQLLDTVRKEKQILIDVDLTSLAENNKLKETLLVKINELEVQWMAIGLELYAVCGVKEEAPRLSEIARYFTGAEQDKLLQIQTLLNLLVQRAAAANKENEELIRSALTHISGAMKAIRDTLSKNSTYEKKGKKNEAPAQTSGRLVSKEV